MARPGPGISPIPSLRELSHAEQGLGAGPHSGLKGLKLMPRTFSRGCAGRVPKMLPAVETWRRLGGTPLGEAVLCGQRGLSPAVAAAQLGR